MIGIVLVMHDPLGAAMLACIKHIMGELPTAFEVLDVPPDEPVDRTLSALKAKAAAVDQGEGVVLLTDLFGATPSNVAIRASQGELAMPSVLVAGCNLPMVLRALGYRHLPLSQVSERLVMGGRNGIVSTGPSTPQRQTFIPADTDDSARSQHQQ